MHEKEEGEEKYYLKAVVPVVVDWVKYYYPIKIMWWFMEPTFIDFFSMYILTVPNMNRIMKNPIVKLALFT